MIEFSDLYPWIVGAVGGTLGAAALLPTKWGEALVKLHADKSLEMFKAEQSRNLEGVKEQLSHLGDRGKRSNENEFTALPQLWDQFVEAYYATYSSLINFMEYPPLNSMSDEDVREFLRENKFRDRDVDSLISAPDKERAFARVVTWRQINQARAEVHKFRKLLRSKRIFISDEIREMFSTAFDMISEAQVEREVAHSSRRAGQEIAFKRFMSDGNRAVDELAAAVNRRLFR